MWINAALNSIFFYVPKYEGVRKIYIARRYEQNIKQGHYSHYRLPHDTDAALNLDHELSFRPSYLPIYGRCGNILVGETLFTGLEKWLSKLEKWFSRLEKQCSHAGDIGSSSWDRNSWGFLTKTKNKKQSYSFGYLTKN